MEDITGWRPSPLRRCTNTFFFPDEEPLQHNTSSHLLPTVRRGPMYSVYAELREEKLIRRKKAGLIISPPPTSLPTKRSSPGSLHSRSVNASLSPAYYWKENKKPMAPLPPPATPRPVASKAKLRRTGSTAEAGRGEEKRRDGVIAMKKSYSCLKELKEFAVVAGYEQEEGKGGKGVHTGVFNKTVASFRRQTTTWMS